MWFCCSWLQLDLFWWKVKISSCFLVQDYVIFKAKKKVQFYRYQLSRCSWGTTNIWNNWSMDTTFSEMCTQWIVGHNIIRIHNNVMWDCQYSTKLFFYFFPHSIWIMFECENFLEIFCETLSVLQNNVGVGNVFVQHHKF